jgi:hypothetical protein
MLALADPLPFAGLALATLLTGAAAWLVVAACGHARQGPLEAALAWGLASLALATGAGVVLGEIGPFAPRGFLAVPCCVLAALALGRRRHLATDFADLRDNLQQARQLLNSGGPARTLALGLLLLLAGLTALAALAEPAVFDAVTYHLPRVGHWLQEERITLLTTAEERMNFVTGIPEVFTAWLLAGTREGFRLSVLPQALGGILAVGATVGLARQAGLSRVAALLAGALLFGMANVAVQFTAAQTDLFTAGIFGAAFLLWLRALARGEASLLGAAGAGLALGAKGTVFYLAPSALVWVLWLGRRHRLPPAAWGRIIGAAALGIALFAGPGFLRNWRAYESILGPREWVEKVHRKTESLGELTAKLGRNLTASLAQNCEPNSQPHGLRTLGRILGTALAARVPERDGFTLDGFSREQTLMNAVIRWPHPDADATSFGLVTIALFGLGTVVAGLRLWQAESRQIALWSVGVLGFMVYYHALQQWHPFGFRYFVLVAPWIAVVAAWGLERLPRRLRLAGWSLALLAAADVTWSVTTRAPNAGWPTVTKPEGNLGGFVASHWREFTRQLEPVDSPLEIALPDESPLTAFYRHHPSRPVTLRRPADRVAATAEAYARAFRGWTIVPASRFLGQEGNVLARVWTFYGDERSPYSLAAYRSLRPGESPAPVLYRDVGTRKGDDLVRQLLVRTWHEPQVRFELRNPGPDAVSYELSTPLGPHHGQLAGRSRTVIAVPLPTQIVVGLNLTFRPPTGSRLGPVDPTVALAP